MNKREQRKEQTTEQALSVETVEARIKLIEAQQQQIQAQGAHHAQELQKLERAFAENVGALRNLRSLVPQSGPVVADRLVGNGSVETRLEAVQSNGQK